MTVYVCCRNVRSASRTRRSSAMSGGVASVRGRDGAVAATAVVAADDDRPAAVAAAAATVAA